MSPELVHILPHWLIYRLEEAITPRGISETFLIQRRSEKNNNLTPDQILRLEEIGFKWDPKDQEWYERFEEYKEYVRENKNPHVPKRHPTLGNWITGLRRSKKNKKLSSKYIDLLNEVGFIWDPKDASWHEFYNELLEYFKDHGNTDVPLSIRRLYTWISNQRKAKKNNELSEERIQLLDEVGFTWDKLEQQWIGKYQKLLHYEKEHGNTKVPQNHPELGDWVSDQRVNKRKNKLSEERIRLLDKVGFIWDASSN